MEQNSFMKIFSWVIVILLIGLVVFIIVRKDKDAVQDGDMEISQAQVETVDVVLKESFPVQADVIVTGNLADSCTTLGSADQQLVGNTFMIDLKSEKPRDPDQVCAQALVPFQTTIALEDIVGITAGDYIVDVNGVQAAFTMDVDNYISDFDPLK